MPKLTVTVSALTRTTGLDRQTVERRLRALKPSRTSQLAGKTVRHYDRAAAEAAVAGSRLEADIRDDVAAATTRLLELRAQVRCGERLPLKRVRAELQARFDAYILSLQNVGRRTCHAILQANAGLADANLKEVMDDVWPLSDGRPATHPRNVEILKLLEAEADARNRALAAPFGWEGEA